MPYYSELGIYMSPTSSYTGSYIPGPYSNHSSLLASNFTRPPPSLLKPRNFRGYKPLLSTINENQSPLRRFNSPKLRGHTSPKVIVPKPIKINTADIDVSVNKYRKYERPKPIQDKIERKSPSPNDNLESPRSSEKEAKPNKIIRRDRPTVRLHTVHSDMISPDNGTNIKSWRDNFEPEELKTEEKKPKKTPGELLKEKFLIRSREDIFKAPEKKVSRRASKKSNVQKTPSFHDICQAITTDQIDEELNPGQPIEIQRRQSRQFSSENLLKDLRRNSADLSNDVKLMNRRNAEVSDTRGSVKRKKKLTKKKSNEKVVLTEVEGNKSQLQRRPTQKKIRRTSTSSSVGSDIVDINPETEKAYQEAIRDISQVEIENIKIKPKPIITATIDVEEKPTLKVVVDEIEVVESPKPKKSNKFKFNVIVEEIDEAKRKSMKKFQSKVEEKVHVPKAKEPLVSNILRKNSNAHLGHILEEQPKEAEEIFPKIVPKNEEKIIAVKKSDSIEKMTNENIETLKKSQNEALSKQISVKKLEVGTILKKENSEKQNTNESTVKQLTQVEKIEPNQIRKTASDDKVLVDKTKEELENQTKTSGNSNQLKQSSSEQNMKMKSEETKKISAEVLQNQNKTCVKVEDEIKVSEPQLVGPKIAADMKKNEDLPKVNITEKMSQGNNTVEKPKEERRSKAVKKDSSLEKIKIEKEGKPKEDEESTAVKKVEAQLKKDSSFDKMKNDKVEKPKEVEKLMAAKKFELQLKKDSSLEQLKSDKVSEKVEIKSCSIVDKSNAILMKEKSDKNLVNKDKELTKILPKLDNKETTQNATKAPESPKTLKPSLKKIQDGQVKKSNSVQIIEEMKQKVGPESPKTPKPSVNKSQETLNKSNSVQKIEETKKENEEENFWAVIGPRESVYTSPRKPLTSKETLEPQKKEEKEEPAADELTPVKPMPSKRSLVNKANKDDPDLEVFIPPPEPEPEPEPEPQPEPTFVPLQSNRLSQFMHPFKKPEQFDECPVEIYATPKVIRHRHYPRPRHPPPPVEKSDSEEEEEEESEEETTSSEETSSDDEYDVNVVYGNNKVGASTSSNDSGFDSGVPGSRNKGSTETQDSPTTNPANNPALALDSNEVLEEYSHSSTFASFQRSGRITPPATTIPRFRKYCVEDFNFLKVLGKGSFGKVLLAELKDTEYYYAIKCLKKDVVLEDDDVECTLIERKVLALATKHPYLCHLLCTFQTESHLFFVMEYLNGGDLMFHIQQSGRFPEAQARFYGAEIVSGLKFLHNKGIVYRDLKLDNILLDFDGHVRIADFGMCKLQIFLDRMADTFCGTPDYMAPEIIKGQHYNQCVDWWSFGVLLYEMLLGQSPFSGCDEDELFWSICNEKPVIPRFLSQEASAVLQLFLEKDANKRLGNRFCPSGDIQDQPFFKPIQWDKLEARLLEPPFKPNLQHPLDTQYFDKTFTAEKAKLTPIEQNILQSMDQTQFQGFSYTNPNATDK